MLPFFCLCVYMCVPNLVKIDWETAAKNPRWPPRNLVFLIFQHQTAVISRASLRSPYLFVCFTSHNTALDKHSEVWDLCKILLKTLLKKFHNISIGNKDSIILEHIFGQNQIPLDAFSLFHTQFSNSALNWLNNAGFFTVPGWQILCSIGLQEL